MIWLIGSGKHAQEYAKVLTALGVNFKVIGRGSKSADIFKAETGINVETGGIDKYLDSKNIPNHAIISTAIEDLLSVCQSLINFGVKNILIEKPGSLTSRGIKNLVELSKFNEVKVWVGYNRRFYLATQSARTIIQEDGGVESFHFEFTEWPDVVLKNIISKRILSKWVISNSSHVIDLAFHLAGYPIKISSYCAKSLEWHPSSKVFAGSGITNTEALFSYHANWGAPGRWSLELATNTHRLIFRPLENLKIMNKNSLEIFTYQTIGNEDEKFKPGLYRQTQAFLFGKTELMCSIQDQYRMMKTYEKIAGYT
jgi:predicted dehydrogenase